MARTRFPCLRHSKASADDWAKLLLLLLVLAGALLELESIDVANDGIVVRLEGVGVTGTDGMDLTRGGGILGDAACEGGLSGRVVVMILLVWVRVMGFALVDCTDPCTELVTDEETE